MEFINGNCTLTASEHKELVKRLFEENKQEDIMTAKFRDLGINMCEGISGKLLYRSFGIIGHITPADIADTDEFCDDFMEMSDFEAFYNKYFGKGEF